MAVPLRRTLLATLCWVPAAEITDGLVDLLIQLVHRINARGEKRVEGEMIADLRRVAGKESILFKLAEAALDHPDETGAPMALMLAVSCRLRIPRRL
jgi:hypothetical protein